MNRKKKTRTVLTIIACVLVVLFGLYYLNVLRIEKGNDYASVKDLTFFVNQPKSCVWVKGLGQKYIDISYLIKSETTVVLMEYDTKEDIHFKNAYNFSEEGFQEDLNDLQKEYSRLLDNISNDLLKKEWEKVYIEGHGSGFGTQNIFKIYTYQNEVLVIATDASW